MDENLKRCINTLEIVKIELFEMKKNLVLLEKINDTVEDYILKDLYEEIELKDLYDKIEKIGVELVILTSYYANRKHYKKNYAEKDIRRKAVILKDEDCFEKAVDTFDGLNLAQHGNSPGVLTLYDYLGLRYFTLNKELNYLGIAKIDGSLNLDIVYDCIHSIIDDRCDSFLEEIEEIRSALLKLDSVE